VYRFDLQILNYAGLAKAYRLGDSAAFFEYHLRPQSVFVSGVLSWVSAVRAMALLRRGYDYPASCQITTTVSLPPSPLILFESLVAVHATLPKTKIVSTVHEEVSE